MSHPSKTDRLRLLIGINLFWLALSALSDGISSLALPARLLQLGGEASATALGLITFGGLLLAMLVQPVAGQFSDRVRHRWGRRGTLALGVAGTLLGLALFALGDTLWLLLASYLVIQGAASVAQAAQQGFIPDLVTEETRGAASGLKSFMDLSGALLGFVVLGQLLAEESATVAVAALAALVLVVFALTVLLVRERNVAPAGPPRERLSLLNSFRIDISDHRAFVWLIAARFLFLLGVYAVGRFLLLFVAYRLGINPDTAAEEAGMVLASLTLVTVLAAIPAGWAADRWGRMPLMVVGSLLSAGGALLFIVAGSEIEIMLFGAVLGLGSAAFSGANWALTADLVPRREAARFFALANFGTAGATAAAGLFGPLVDWANGAAAGSGYTLLFILSATAYLATLGALWQVRRWREWEEAGVGEQLETAMS